FQELQLERDTMLTTNRSLAEESLSLRPRLDNGKLQLAGKYQELELLSASCQEKQERVGKSRKNTVLKMQGKQTTERASRISVSQLKEHRGSVFLN
ncbi:Vacuolar protein sorting-associated protein 37D, partial [Acipenser ruthenus]